MVVPWLLTTAAGAVNLELSENMREYINSTVGNFLFSLVKPCVGLSMNRGSRYTGVC